MNSSSKKAPGNIKIENVLSNRFDALFISSVSNIIYFTGYAGFSKEEREAFVLFTEKSQYIFTDARYTTAVKQLLRHFSLQEISTKTPLKTLLQNILEQEKIKILGLEEYNLTAKEFQGIKKTVKSLSPKIRLKPIGSLLATIRQIKTAKEISAIKDACALGDKAFSFILTQIKPGISEKELAKKLAYYILENNADLSFPTIVAFGKNAAIPHHVTSNKKLAKNSFILFDFGVKHNNYCSDMTRTVFFGIPTKEQKKIYQVVYESQQKAFEFLQKALIKKSNNNIIASDVDAVARKHIAQQGYPSIPHSLGHGIGIDVHETPRLSPNSKTKLVDGMVFSIEPGIYLPGHFGVRIEDLIAITGDKMKVLTTAPKKFMIISPSSPRKITSL